MVMICSEIALQCKVEGCLCLVKLQSYRKKYFYVRNMCLAKTCECALTTLSVN